MLTTNVPVPIGHWIPIYIEHFGAQYFSGMASDICLEGISGTIQLSQVGFRPEE